MTTTIEEIKNEAIKFANEFKNTYIACGKRCCKEKLAGEPNEYLEARLNNYDRSFVCVMTGVEDHDYEMTEDYEYDSHFRCMKRNAEDIRDWMSEYIAA